MAKNDNLKDFLTDVADAIREKKGTSEPINPQDFSSEIASIETGGGGSSMEYWAVPEDVGEDVREFVEDDLRTHLFCVKLYVDAQTIIFASTAVMGFSGTLALAVGIDRSFRAGSNGQLATIDEFLQSQGTSLDMLGLTQITEEEFYAV